MLGSLGIPELLFIFGLALLVFGPKRLPEVGRALGRGMAELRKASNDLKRTINAEMIEQEMREHDPRRMVRDSLSEVKKSLTADLSPPATTTKPGGKSAADGAVGQSAADGAVDQSAADGAVDKSAGSPAGADAGKSAVGGDGQSAADGAVGAAQADEPAAQPKAVEGSVARGRSPAGDAPAGDAPASDAPGGEDSGQGGGPS